MLADPATFEFQRILVIRIDHIGDVVMSTPIFRALRSRYPNARIVAMTGSWGKGVLANNPNIDDIVVFDAPWWAGVRGGGRRWSRLWQFATDYRQLLRRLRKEKFDLVLDPRGDMRHIAMFALASGAPYRIGYGRTGGAYLLTHEVPFRPKLHNVAKNREILRPLGIADEIPTEIYAGPSERDRVARLLAENGIDAAARLAVLHPGARTMVKKWPPDHFARVADHLQSLGYSVVIVGGKEEMELSQQVAVAMQKAPVLLAGKLSLMELVALFERGQLFLCNDSGPMHLAAATRIPMVAVFGPTDPGIYGYKSPHQDWVYQRLPCSPCHYENHCPYSVGNASQCMSELPAGDVIAKVDELLAGL